MGALAQFYTAGIGVNLPTQSATATPAGAIRLTLYTPITGRTQATYRLLGGEAKSTVKKS